MYNIKAVFRDIILLACFVNINCNCWWIKKTTYCNVKIIIQGTILGKTITYDVEDNIPKNCNI